LKSFDFAEAKPDNNEGKYMFDHKEEHEYRRAYRAARYGRTKKKSGGDCMRHYEILSSGSVPSFEEIEHSPAHTLAHFPKELLARARDLPGVDPVAGTINSEAFDHDEYLCLADELLRYTREYLTTKSVAEYVLRVAGKPRARNILYLSGHEGADYVRDMLLHGLKSVVKENNGVVVDYVKPPHLYDIADDTPPHGWSNENIYGLGFSTAHRLTEVDDPGDASFVDRSNLSERILNKEFDVVVYGSVHRGMLFLDEVIEAYGGEIVFVDGEDMHGMCTKVQKFAKMGHYFMREIGDDCEVIQ